MNADRHGDDAAEPGDDAVAAAFAAYRADAPSAFPPPSVDDLIMSGPAALRRRRIVSLAAVVGACTAVTAGGFAVAQTLGSPEPAEQAPPTALQGPASESSPQDTQLGATQAPPTGGAGEDEATATAGADEASSTIAVGDWDGVCAGGSFEVDTETWELTDGSEWTVGQALVGDVTGDEAPETVLSLTCRERTAVAAFSGDQSDLAHMAWVWQPDESQALSEIAGLEAGVITLQGLDDASATWTARYEWDGGAFVAIDQEPSTGPSPSETPATPEPDETHTTQATPTGEAGD
ncbi:hypothetical protein GCM10027447_13640 [Glycomyces halotolerans]